jgi:hypothetical protein
LLLIGAVPRYSYVAVDGDRVRVQFGLFRYNLERRRIVGAQRVTANWLYGIGIHANLVSALCVNGSLGGMVELHLAPPQLFWVLFVPARCLRFYVSLENPDGFLATLGVGAAGPR